MLQQGCRIAFPGEIHTVAVSFVFDVKLHINLQCQRTQKKLVLFLRPLHVPFPVALAKMLLPLSAVSCSYQRIYCPDPWFHSPASCNPGVLTSQDPKKSLTKFGSLWSKFQATRAQMKSSLSRVIHSSHLFKHSHSPRTDWQPSLWVVDSTALLGTVLRQVHITRQWRWTASFSSGMERSNC